MHPAVLTSASYVVALFAWVKSQCAVVWLGCLRCTNTPLPTHTSFPSHLSQALLAWTAGMEKAETFSFVCLSFFFFYSPKVNSCWVFLLVSAKQQLVCEGGIPGFRMFVCFHTVVLPELLDPSYVVMVKTWRQSCRQELRGCNRNSRHPCLVLLPCRPFFQTLLVLLRQRLLFVSQCHKSPRSKNRQRISETAQMTSPQLIRPSVCVKT